MPAEAITNPCCPASLRTQDPPDSPDHVFTLGIEEEFQIINRETRELRSRIQQIFVDCGSADFFREHAPFGLIAASAVFMLECCCLCHWSTLQGLRFVDCFPLATPKPRKRGLSG